MIFRDTRVPNLRYRAQPDQRQKRRRHDEEKASGGLFNYSHSPRLDSAIPITGAKEDTTVRLIELNGGRRFKKRLTALGLVSREPIRIINNSGGGPILLEVKDTRLALGRGEAAKILVRELGVRHTNVPYPHNTAENQKN